MCDLLKGEKHCKRLLVPLLGIALLVSLVAKADRRFLVSGARKIGWDILWVIALAGFSHLIRTLAWRLALCDEAHKVSFARTLGLRLVSEAIGQFGFLGMIAGDTTRVALLGPDVSVAHAISSVALDRCLFIATGAMVTVAGVLMTLAVVSLSHVLRLSAAILASSLVILLIFAGIAVHKRWRVFSTTADAVTRIPRLTHWFQDKWSILLSAEEQIVSFHRSQPTAFVGSMSLNLVSHALAIAEVYLILRLLGTPVTPFTAFILESLTKLISVVGAVNPGNLGTYEGGNMVIGRLVHLSADQGLTLALCRRLRAVFWAIIGALCLIELSRSATKAIPASVLE